MVGRRNVGVEKPLSPARRHYTAGHDRRSGAAGAGTWVVLPTYDEAENIGPIAAAILDALPGGDAARRRRRLARRHRPARRRAGRRRSAHPRPASGGQAGARPGLSRRVRDRARRRRARPSSRWTPTSATTRRSCRRSSAPIADGTADLVIGSRYTAGGGVVDWGIGRRLVSRGGSLFARIVLGLGPHDLTGGFKAWRATTLAAVPFDGVHAGGYVFQIEMTFRASRAGARIREIPITFRDRRVGQSKMSRRIVVEALVVVVQLAARGDRCRDRPQRWRGGRAADDLTADAAAPAPPRTRRRHGRARPPGAGPRPADRGLPRRSAWRLRRRPARRASRSRSCSPVRPGRPDPALPAPRGRSADGCCPRPGCCARWR